MTTHNPPSDCVGHCVGTASEKVIPAQPKRLRRPVPLPSGTDAVSEPPTTASEPLRPLRRWTPEHESTREAWEAVTANLQDRQDRGLWSSRTIAETIAQHAGLNRPRAADLIRSAIRHGYLEERDSPCKGSSTQVRLTSADQSLSSSRVRGAA